MTRLEADALQPLTSVLPEPVDQHIKSRFIAETLGNPLAILELGQPLPALSELGGEGRQSSVGYMDTDMTTHVTAPKADPRDIAAQAADAIIAGQCEILADDTTRAVKAQLSRDVTALYSDLAAA